MGAPPGPVLPGPPPVQATQPASAVSTGEGPLSLSPQTTQRSSALLANTTGDGTGSRLPSSGVRLIDATPGGGRIVSEAPVPGSSLLTSSSPSSSGNSENPVGVSSSSISPSVHGVVSTVLPSSFVPGGGGGEREGRVQSGLTSPTSGVMMMESPVAFVPSANLEPSEQQGGASLQLRQDGSVFSSSPSTPSSGGAVYTPDVPSSSSSSVVLPSTSGSLVEAVLSESASSSSYSRGGIFWSWLISPLASIPAFIASRVLWLMKVFAVVSAILMQLSPLPTIMRIKACRSTADLQGLPYVLLLLSAVVWLAYGVLRLDIVVLIPNITGVLLSVWYVRIFVRYCKNEDQNRVMRIYIGSSLFLLASLLLVFSILGLSQGTRLIGLSAGKTRKPYNSSRPRLQTRDTSVHV